MRGVLTIGAALLVAGAVTGAAETAARRDGKGVESKQGPHQLKATGAVTV